MTTGKFLGRYRWSMIDAQADITREPERLSKHAPYSPCACPHKCAASPSPAAAYASRICGDLACVMSTSTSGRYAAGGGMRGDGEAAQERHAGGEGSAWRGYGMRGAVMRSHGAPGGSP